MKTDWDLKDYLAERKKRVDEALETCLPPEDAYPPELISAMRYSLFAGGKRLRPILCLAAAEAVGGRPYTVMPVACALEMIHTYSLIHDDLPAMDNDDYRRGRLTNHKVFGDAMAILAGDALLTEAFHLMANRERMAGVDPSALLTVIRDVAEAAGYGGMVGGQAIDILSEGRQGDADTLDYIHTHKTAAMIIVSVSAGAVLSGAGAAELDALAAYGRHIGLAFQIADDILNVEGDQALLGKSTGSDATRGKLTYPGLMGLAEARRRARELTESALGDLAVFDDRALPLRQIAEYNMERKS